MGTLSRIKNDGKTPEKTPAKIPARLPARPSATIAPIASTTPPTALPTASAPPPIAPPPATKKLPPVPQKFSTPAANSSSQPATPQNFPPDSPPTSPCKICGSPIFWQSISRDGKYHCGICEEVPAAMIGEKFEIVTFLGADGEPKHELRKLSEVTEEIETAEEIETETNQKNLPTEKLASRKSPYEKPESQFSQFLPQWTSPDPGGWCYGRDCEGGEHWRHVSLLPRVDRFEGRQGSGSAGSSFGSSSQPETQENYLRRLEQHRRIREPSLRWLDETGAEHERRLVAMDEAVKLTVVKLTMGMTERKLARV